MAKTLQDRSNSGLPADVAEAAAAARSLPDRYVSVREDGLPEYQIGIRPRGEGAIIRSAATRDFRVTVAGR